MSDEDPETVCPLQSLTAHVCAIARVFPQPMFKSKLGLVLSCLGCVVGTGNIWRYPRIVANNSGDQGAE
jgi:hypothetical protein